MVRLYEQSHNKKCNSTYGPRGIIEVMIKHFEATYTYMHATFFFKLRPGVLFNRFTIFATLILFITRIRVNGVLLLIVDQIKPLTLTQDFLLLWKNMSINRDMGSAMWQPCMWEGLILERHIFPYSVKLRGKPF